MRIREFSKPRPFLVIDHFFTDENYKKIWRDLLALEDQMQIGLNGSRVISKIKKNRMTILKDQGRTNPQLVKMVTKTLWSKEFKKNLEERSNPLFSILHHCKPGPLQVSSYKNGDFYDRHRDGNPIANLTVLIFICDVRKRFTGGDLELEFASQKKLIKFVNNRVVIFPSDTWHRVTPIELSSEEFAHSRFSLQLWPILEATSARYKSRQDLMTSKLTPRFHFSPGVWKFAEQFIRTLEGTSVWKGDLPVALKQFHMITHILSSNLKYLRDSGQLKGHLVNSFSEIIMKPRPQLRLWDEIRSEHGIYSCGYILEKERGKKLRLFLFVMTRKNRQRKEFKMAIPPATDYSKTVRILRHLFLSAF